MTAACTLRCAARSTTRVSGAWCSSTRRAMSREHSRTRISAPRRRQSSAFAMRSRPRSASRPKDRHKPPRSRTPNRHNGLVGGSAMAGYSNTPGFEALHVPPAAMEQGGVEVLRAVIVDGALHVSLRRAFDDPEAWGMLIADITRHVARIYATEDKFRESETVERIRAIYEAEMDAPTDPGTTSALS